MKIFRPMRQIFLHELWKKTVWKCSIDGYTCMSMILSIKRKIPNRLFNNSCMKICPISRQFFISSQYIPNFGTLYDTVSKKIVHTKITFYWCFEKNCKGFPCSRPYLPHRPAHLSFNLQMIIFDTLFDTVSQRIRKEM